LLRWIGLNRLALLAKADPIVEKQFGSSVWPVEQRISGPAPAFPQMVERLNALVLPASHRRINARRPDGGPLDPAMMDATVGADQPDRIHDAAVWVGHLDRHFGHLTTEHLPRLPVGLLQRPNDLFLFTVDPGMTDADIPSWFPGLVGWYGLNMDQIRFIRRPTLVDHLRIPELAEVLGGHGPTDDYLSLLDRIAMRNALEPQHQPLVYVERTAMLARGSGGHAGETYLVKVLRKLGVPVIDPGTLAFRDQLAIYAGAKQIIFAEGTALHGRQGLGFANQTITILNRRLNERMGEPQIKRRCEKLTYVDTVRKIICPIRRDGALHMSYGISFYDTKVLFGAFRSAGVNLKPVWDDAEFKASVRHDVQAWISGNRARWSPAVFIKKTAPMRKPLREEGCEGLLGEKGRHS
jgi:hypothetical protein